MKKSVLDSIALRAHYLANQMIFQANHRSDKEKGDPKVGGHSSASSSALHIMGALHLLVKTGFDHVANKPHASPADHSYNYLLDLFLKSDFSKLSLEECNQAMMGLRAFPQNGEYVFQSYHSTYDSDHHNFFPSGTVGIPPVQAGYLAHAYRFAKQHGYDVPDAHFWAVMGDSEFREGSLHEAIPEFAEREIGNLTWIIDYNRQSLDGHRITNKEIMGGNDSDRIEKSMAANGWEVIQLQHGKKREELFGKKEGAAFKKLLEEELTDYELQALLLLPTGKELKASMSKTHSHMKKFLEATADQALYDALHDFGGHDMEALAEAMERSKKSKKKPTMIIAHTIKGWGLKMAATPGNHSALPTEEEMEFLRQRQGLKNDTLFARFDSNSEEGKFLKKRGEELFKQILQQSELKEKNKKKYLAEIEKNGPIPGALDINLKMASYPHTQWMLGQLTAKLTRIANTPAKGAEKALNKEEMAWKVAAEGLITMAPDVGTSTNLNPAMDGKIFGAVVTEDFEENFGVKDNKTPDLIPGQEASDRFLRFEIAEGNTMSCLGSYGRMRDILGLPMLPLMTVYDFFIKRALDQLFYNLYWKSSFILVGTPSGVTLSPEGAQHGWKSDIQIPNQITWEPAFCVELDWILCDAIKRHVTFDNEGRTGVIIRGVTRGIEQKLLMQNLKRQKRFKLGLMDEQLLSPVSYPLEGAVPEDQVAAIDETEILSSLREDVLRGAYYLVDYRGYAGYDPGDNVVHIFAMGSMVTEALAASEELLAKGIYANVIVVTCTDLLVGNLAHENNYDVLRRGLGIDSRLYIQPIMNGHHSSAEMMTIAGRRIPIVSVHDGEPGLLDNIGSIIGVRHESLAVRKHSRCGRPRDIYAYHHIDKESVVEAAGKVLSETALEGVEVSKDVLQQIAGMNPTGADWRQLWPPQHES